jgi:tRNA(fMet)-specific endonuclease VapC
VTPRFLLDTSIVSEPIKPAPNLDLLRNIERNTHQSAIAAPVWHELQYGCQLLPAGKRRTAIEAYLLEVIRRTFPILPYDEVAAAWHASERARLERAGGAVPFVDGQIAAIAKIHGLVMVTMNVRDFARFEGLEVENWASRPRRKR